MKLSKFTDTISGDIVRYTYVEEEFYFPINNIRKYIDAGNLIEIDGKQAKDIRSFKWFREHGLPAYLKEDVSYFFYNMETEHRINGPAVYFFAIEETGSDSRADWYYEGVEFDPEDYFSFLDLHGIDINCLSENDRLLIAIWAADL